MNFVYGVCDISKVCALSKHELKFPGTLRIQSTK